MKVPGLDGSGKMGKSEGEGNAIFLADPPETIRKKIMRAVTDSGPVTPGQEMPESIANLFSLMSLVSSEETINFFKEKYSDCSIRYGDFKKQLAEDMVQFISPITEEINRIASDEHLINKVMDQGAEKARHSASKSIREARQIIGFRNN